MVPVPGVFGVDVSAVRVLPLLPLAKGVEVRLDVAAVLVQARDVALKDLQPHQDEAKLRRELLRVVEELHGVEVHEDNVLDDGHGVTLGGPLVLVHDVVDKNRNLDGLVAAAAGAGGPLTPHVPPVASSFGKSSHFQVHHVSVKYRDAYDEMTLKLDGQNGKQSNVDGRETSTDVVCEP